MHLAQLLQRNQAVHQSNSQNQKENALETVELGWLEREVAFAFVAKILPP